METLTRESLAQTEPDEFKTWRPEQPGDYVIGTVTEIDQRYETKFGEKLRIELRAKEGEYHTPEGKAVVLQLNEFYTVWGRTHLTRSLASRDVRSGDELGITFLYTDDKRTKIFAVQVIPNKEAREASRINQEAIDIRTRDAAAREERLQAERDNPQQVELTSDVDTLGDADLPESLGGIE